jgi:hypothetical protein
MKKMKTEDGGKLLVTLLCWVSVIAFCMRFFNQQMTLYEIYNYGFGMVFELAFGIIFTLVMLASL